MRRRPDQRGRRLGDERGNTLVEVLAAGTVLGVLALGLASLWAVFDRLSFEAMLRQKAVFVLNGEMERLHALFTRTGFGAGNRPSTTGYPALGTVPTTRRIFAGNSTGVTFAATTHAAFTAADTQVRVEGTGTAARNYVWLDRERNLAARLSWAECPVTADAAAECWDGTSFAARPKPREDKSHRCRAFSNLGGASGGDFCLLVTIVLEYPFRVDTAGGFAAMPTGLRSLTLSTIVGRRA